MVDAVMRTPTTQPMNKVGANPFADLPMLASFKCCCGVDAWLAFIWDYATSHFTARVAQEWLHFYMPKCVPKHNEIPFEMTVSTHTTPFLLLLTRFGTARRMSIWR